MAKKIVFLQNKLLHYRRSFYEEMAKKYDVVVIHSGNVSKDLENFREIVLPAKVLGPFYWQKNIIQCILKENPEIIVAMFDIHWASIFWAYFCSRSKAGVKWVWWGLDEGGSKFALKLKLLVAKDLNPIVFYTNHAKNKFIDYGVDSNKLFVGNNTFHVSDRIMSSGERNIVLNVGSLDQRKRNDVLIRAFSEALKLIHVPAYLYIIGDGEQKTVLKSLVAELSLEEVVYIVPSINKTDELKKYYDRAVASISYGQAGLAVLQSMAYGVPFITRLDAISGGEKFNIVNESNGIFLDEKFDSLVLIIARLFNDKKFSKKLGLSAYKYYSDNCTIDKMTLGFHDAIKYCEEIK